LFTNAVNVFGTPEPKEALPNLSQSVEPNPHVASVPTNTGTKKGSPQPMAAGERPHAISPNQPSSESPALTPPSTQMAQEEFPIPPSEPVQDVQVRSAELLIVTSEATIRDGPSKKAKKIGSLSAGSKLQVKRRENEFVQFVDPSSSNTGWILSSLLAESGLEGVGPPQSASAPATTNPDKTKLTKKRSSVPPLPRAYADLPADEEFLSPRRHGAGLLIKRRMLREGLMSPDFRPPQ